MWFNCEGEDGIVRDNLSDQVVSEAGEMEITFSSWNNMCKDTNLMVELQVFVEGKSGWCLANTRENDGREAGMKAWSRKPRFFQTSVKYLGLFSGAAVTKTAHSWEEVQWEGSSGQTDGEDSWCHDQEFKQSNYVTSELDPALPKQPRTFFLLD